MRGYSVTTYPHSLPVRRVALAAVLALIAGLFAALGASPPAGAEQASSETRRVAAASIATGGYHTCVITTTNDVRCWGDNRDGQLGYGIATDYWGNDPDETPASKGNVPIGGKATAITAGDQHTCVLLTTGDVRCWGQNADGQLGYGHTNIIGENETPASQPVVPLGGKAVAIEAGYEDTCAILVGGDVRCWGDNQHGQLGYGHINDIGDDETPASQPAVPLGGKAAAISLSYHTCALLTSGDLRCWGPASIGQLGYGDGVSDDYGDEPGETPAAKGNVPLGGKAMAISAGYSFTCAVLTSGHVRCWGYNQRGQLGYGAGTANYGEHVGETPAAKGNVPLGGKAIAIATSDDYSYACAVLTTDAVRCWGENDSGKLGYGDGDSQYVGDDETPAAKGDVPLGGNVVAVATGSEHTCATLVTGDIRCWGRGFGGPLGHGDPDTWGDDAGETPAAKGNVPLGAKVRVKADPTLKAKVKPKKDKKPPYKFKVKGKLDGLFVKDAATCGGTVKVKVKAKGRNNKGKKKTKKVLKKKTRILDTCKIKKKKLKIKPKKLKKKGFDLDRKKIKVKVVMKYQGTDNLEKAKKKRKAKIKLN